MIKLETNGVDIFDYDRLRTAYLNGTIDMDDDVLWAAIERLSPYNSKQEKHDEFINLTVRRSTYALLTKTK